VTVILIAAVARNGVIGNDGAIPWRVPGEQRFFRDVTMGHTLLMGRATYDSIGRPLPGRTTIVLTRDPLWAAEGVRTAPGIEEALAMASGDVYVAGGAAVYSAAMPYADEQLISEIPLEPEGDTFYPAYDSREWVETSREPHAGFEVVRLSPR
jgi:dihydrofolate reductase